ncbi:MAG: hypothetical protein AAGI44_13385 [Pseudomonadota bacterium]
MENLKIQIFNHAGDALVLRLQHDIKNGWAVSTGPCSTLPDAFDELALMIERSTVIPTELKQRLLEGE